MHVHMHTHTHTHTNTHTHTQTPQLKSNITTEAQRKAAAANGTTSSSDEGSSLSLVTSPSVDLTTIDELKRAFELVEVSSPGIGDQLLSRIFVRLQHR